jgi:hypothetical protein
LGLFWCAEWRWRGRGRGAWWWRAARRLVAARGPAVTVFAGSDERCRLWRGSVGLVGDGPLVRRRGVLVFG